ncbi:MAG: glycosyltransferase family 9 protein [Verrucomicrobiota bacterium]|nr:glycosyltransferase family 9 protein [Verrucomicrobiota bacterium]
MSKTKGKILVIRGGAIGDFILTIPVLQALKAYFPKTHLEVLGYPRVANLAVEAGWAQATKSIEAPGLVRFFAAKGPVPPEWLHYFSQFDIIISYLYDPDGIFQHNLSYAGKHHFIKGPHRPDASLKLHAIDVFLKPLEKLAVYETGLLPDLSPLAGARAPSEENQVCVAVHPGSGSPNKNWPLERWTALLELISQVDHIEIRIFGGEAERHQCKSLMSQLHATKVNLVMHRPLHEVARSIAHCDAFIGHDSGISHMATALGIPSVILWGPSNLHIWGPVGKHVTIIEAETGLSGITPEQVRRELNRLMEMRKS